MLKLNELLIDISNSKDNAKVIEEFFQVFFKSKTHLIKEYKFVLV